MTFYYGEQPWIPTLWDLEAFKGEGDEYYKRFGFDQLEVDSQYTHVSEAMPRLTERFNNRYAERMINRETLEQWQLALQNKMDEIAPRYDRAYQIYAMKKQAMLDDVEEGSHTITSQTIEGKNTTKDTSKASSKTRNIDTPDSAINANPNYADSLSENSVENDGNVENAQKSTISGDSKTVSTGGSLLRSINDSIDDWRELDTEFVAEFENNFLNIFWY